MIFYGLRGVGKTVLLTTSRNHAEGVGLVVVAMEAPENRSLPALLNPCATRRALENEPDKAHWSKDPLRSFSTCRVREAAQFV